MDQKLSKSEALLQSVIRIECDLNDGKKSTGTGFYFAYSRTDSQWDKIVIATNKHVIEKSINLTVYLTPLNAEYLPNYHSNYILKLNISENDWIMHPEELVDLCVLPLPKELEDNISLFCYEKKYIPTKEVLESLRVNEDIVMIGYPNGLWDRTNNLPIYRKGITASHPKFYFNGRKEFLIDAACFEGSSGSPVFIFNQGGHITKEGDLDLENRFILLGVLHSGPKYSLEGDVIIKPIRTNGEDLASYSQIPINLGYVLNSERILEMEALLK